MDHDNAPICNQTVIIQSYTKGLYFEHVIDNVMIHINWLNRCSAEFNLGNTQTYLHLSFLTPMDHVV